MKYWIYGADRNFDLYALSGTETQDDCPVLTRPLACKQIPVAAFKLIAQRPFELLSQKWFDLVVISDLETEGRSFKINTHNVEPREEHCTKRQLHCC